MAAVPADSPTTRPHPLRRRLLIAGGLLALLLVVLLLLALPFRGVQADARSAQDSLTAAASALRAGDLDAAEQHADDARRDVDDVRDVTEGASGRVWSLVPLAGSGVRDARHLATALHEVTAAVEVTLDTYRRVSGPGADLFVDGGVEVDVLERALTGLDQVQGHVYDARDSLHEVEGTNMFVGDPLATARDDALAEVEPVADDLEDLEPLLDTLPTLLGAEKEQRYVVAMLNPAEMRYSGGAMLTFAGVRLEEGMMHRSPSRDTSTAGIMFRPIRWTGVEGNTFRSPYRQRISHANIAPSWPVAGEETLRAWEKLKNYEPDGLVALDIVALARMLEVTGPLQVPGYGEITADNLVEQTIGSYDEFDLAETARRHALNRQLIPAFSERLFGGVDLVGTVQALADAAKGRHFAMYFRDERLQEAAADLRLTGELSDTEHDYVGVFTQNLVSSKSDYWQSKAIRSDVSLRPDGSARVVLDVQVDNTAPTTPPRFPSDYTDRRLSMSLVNFLPAGARVREASWRGVAFEPEVREYFGRSFLTRETLLEAGESTTLRLVYDVPQAAVADGDRLSYQLDIDPHPTVIPERVDVRVRWPQGYVVEGLPDGWTSSGPRTATYRTDALDGRKAWRLDGRRSG